MPRRFPSWSAQWNSRRKMSVFRTCYQSFKLNGNCSAKHAPVIAEVAGFGDRRLIFFSHAEQTVSPRWDGAGLPGPLCLDGAPHLHVEGSEHLSSLRVYADAARHSQTSDHPYRAEIDTSAPTHRDKAFAEYKAHRQAMPEDITQPQGIRANARRLQFPVLTCDGYEAMM